MKKTNFDTNATRPACCSTRQNVFGVIALVGLFACGVMIGVAMNGHAKKSVVNDASCDYVAQKIVDVSSGKCYGGKSCLEQLQELNEMYSKNCGGHEFVSNQKPAPKVEDAADKKTCEVIEEMLAGWLCDEREVDETCHRNNIHWYEKLVQNGCPENTEKYQALIQREQEILAALTGNVASENTQTCAEIERLLQEQLAYLKEETIAEVRIDRAKIYANMSERGCAENSQKYKDLAAKELEIARALQDDNFSDSDRAQISDTYRRIQMKQAANQILNKVQQLADPAIDFIIQAQKIIEE